MCLAVPVEPDEQFDEFVFVQRLRVSMNLQIFKLLGDDCDIVARDVARAALPQARTSIAYHHRMQLSGWAAKQPSLWALAPAPITVAVAILFMLKPCPPKTRPRSARAPLLSGSPLLELAEFPRTSRMWLTHC